MPYDPRQPDVGNKGSQTGFNNDPGYNGGVNYGHYTDQDVGGGYFGKRVTSGQIDSTDDRGQTRAEYGGQFGTSNNIASQYGDQAAKYQNRHLGEEFSSPYRQAQGNAGSRGQLRDALAMQHQAMVGGVPSAAAINQSAGFSAGLADQFAAAHAGGNVGLSAMQAQNAGARMSLGNIQQGAAGREAETQGATNSYLHGLAGLQSGDVRALSIDQQRELQQASLNQRMQLGSQGLANSVLEDQLRADTTAYDTMYAGERGALTAAQLDYSRFGADRFNAAVGAGAGLAGAYAQAQAAKEGSGVISYGQPTEADLENPYYATPQ